MFAVLALGTPLGASAQQLAQRVRSSDGVVTFQLHARPGVCGDGSRYIHVGRSYMGQVGRDGFSAPCVAGPVHVRLQVRNGDVERLDAYVGPRAAEGRDLGMVGSAEGTAFLLSIAASADGNAGQKAIMPAVIADSSVVWPALLKIARDRDRPRATRNEASFWLSRLAGASLAGVPNDPTAGEPDTHGAKDEDDEKTNAVFVLSQLSGGRGIEPMLDIARSNPDLKVRNSALFWLGQSGDPRAVDLFESILRR
ncbi:MAG: lyase domain protein repeat-containing protein [Gemmatimonadetes bacterium]|nr:lyase domain protein repeat-containing protein [Gemmatimonadota bacterium]